MSHHLPLIAAAAFAALVLPRLLSPRRRATRAQFRQWAAFHEDEAAELRHGIPRAGRNPRIQPDVIEQARRYLAEAEAAAAHCRRQARRGWWR